MDLIAYLGIFCMWCVCCVQDRMCRAVGFCLVIVVNLYDVRKNFQIAD